MTTQHTSHGLFSRLRTVPGIRAASSYRREWLVKDLVAGVVLTTLLVPQGMAYAELAGLPTITGLYTTILCLLGYAVCGPSRILVLGPDSSLGPMIAATVLPLVAAGGDPDRAVALASMLALMVAAIMILASVAKLGFIADLISKPTMIGYMNGLALTILIGQLPKLLGFKVEADNLIGECVGFVQKLADGAAVPAAAAVGCCGIVLILVLQRFLPKVPAVLAMVVLAIAATTVFDLGEHGVSLVGELPKGFPPFTIPDVRLADLAPLFGGALGIALVSLADTISNASAFAARTGQEVRGNQEMAGVGVANLAAGLFQGFPVSTSGSRTAVAERAGARSQLTGVVGAALIVLMLVLAPGLFRNLPSRPSPPWSSPRHSPWPTSRGRYGCGGSAGRSSCCASRPSRAWPCSAYWPGSPSPWPCPSSTSSDARGGRTTPCWGGCRAWRATTTSAPTHRPGSCRAW